MVHGKCSLIEKMPGEYNDKFKNMRTFLAFMMAHPGKKLLFMGQEFAQFKEWDYQSELDWMLLEYERHAQMQSCTREINKFYLKTPAFWEIDYSWEGFKWIAADDTAQSIISFRRIDKSGKEVICVCNFVPVTRENYRIGVPRDGRYKVVLDTDAAEFGGDGILKERGIRSFKVEDEPMHGLDHSISLTLPALSTLYLVNEPPRRRSRPLLPEKTDK